MANSYDVVIVGGGAAGLTAAMYTARLGLKTAVVEQMMPGAQIINAESIETFPGFPDGISGAELSPRLQEQAQKSGAEIVMAQAQSLVLQNPYRILATSEGELVAKAVIIAGGSTLKRLGIPGEEEFWGKGISQCATCDGPLFQDAVVGVVGGGDSAADEALTLTSYCSKVYLFHRRNSLRAQHTLQERLRASSKVEIVWNTVVERVLGEDKVTGVQIRNLVSNLTSRVKLAGLFVFVGLNPNTQWLKDVLKTDNAGHIPVNLWMETETPGIYAAGDIRQHSAAQLASAAGDGATAAISAFHYIKARQWPTLEKH